MGLTEREFGWVEGFIDGEGCLYFYMHRHKGCKRGFAWNPGISIANTRVDALEFIQEKIGGGAIRKFKGKEWTENGWKPLYRLDIGAKLLRIWLPRLHLRLKARQQVLLLEALRLISEQHGGFKAYTPHDARLGEICAEMKRLNHRGLPNL